MSKFIHLPILVLFTTLFLTSCSETGVKIPKDHQPFEFLSDYNLFQGDIHDLKPSEGVIPYEVNTPLFSDYALKKRFIYIPKGDTAHALEDGTIDYPNGTVLVKNFYYESGEKTNLIETRLLIKTDSKWDAYPYVWDKEQKTAKLNVSGPDVPVTFEHLGKKISFNYSVPNKNQCKNCHNSSDILEPIGPKLGNLNKMMKYVDASMNQLDYWNKKGMLSYHRNDSTPFFPPWDDNHFSLNERARSYLEVNCGHCHSPKGSASTSGLFLQYANKNLAQIGFFKSPVAAGTGSGGFDYDILPGKPDESILTYRMSSTNPGDMMPEIGRKLVHQEGVQLVKEWIKSLDTQPQ